MFVCYSCCDVRKLQSVLILFRNFVDRYPGTTFIDHILRYQDNDDVKMIVVLGEVIYSLSLRRLYHYSVPVFD